jgi:hypothetical protein
MLNKWWVSLRTCYIVHSKAAHIIAKFKTDYHKNGISVISSVLGFKLNINNYKWWLCDLKLSQEIIQNSQLPSNTVVNKGKKFLDGA